MINRVSKTRAAAMIWKYYLDTSIYNIGLSVLVAMYAGFIWGFLIFGSLGTLVGFLAYSYFKEREYYFYYNYGYTKKMLMKRVWGINLIVVLLSFGMYAFTLKLF